MEDFDGELCCSISGMALSESVRAQLERIVTSVPAEPLNEQGVDWGGSWFCPADGEPMAMRSTKLPQCRSCERWLDDRVLYQLIERHTHLPAPGWTSAR